MYSFVTYQRVCFLNYVKNIKLFCNNKYFCKIIFNIYKLNIENYKNNLIPSLALILNMYVFNLFFFQILC